MKRLVLLFCCLAPLPGETGFLDRELSLAGEMFRYQVYVPRNFSPQQKWPVILFLHGGGESGKDGLKQSAVGLPQAVRLHPERFPAVIVLPQSSRERPWSHELEQAQALAALDKSIAEFNGDPDRVYLTGLSKGGHGAWRLAYREPSRFAALVPICGAIVPRRLLEQPGIKESDIPNAAQIAAKLGPELRIWVFHGAADSTVPVENSREMVKALRALGSQVRYTEYEGVGHNSWDRAYNDPELPAWLFAQKRKPADRPAGQTRQ